MPAASTTLVWATFDSVLDAPNGKSTTTQTPVAVPVQSGLAISTAPGLMQTVLQAVADRRLDFTLHVLGGELRLEDEWSM